MQLDFWKGTISTGNTRWSNCRTSNELISIHHQRVFIWFSSWSHPFSVSPLDVDWITELKEIWLHVNQLDIAVCSCLTETSGYIVAYCIMCGPVNLNLTLVPLYLFSPFSRILSRSLDQTAGMWRPGNLKIWGQKLHHFLRSFCRDASVLPDIISQ